MPEEDNETWLLEEGHRVIERKVAEGYFSLPPRERLIYCLWVADYGMRNAGDLAPAEDLYPSVLPDGLSVARELDLPRCVEAFSLPPGELEERYFSLFDAIASELRAIGTNAA